MALTGGFFSNKSTYQGLKQREEYSVINIGTEQFHAAAVALIDSLQNTQRGNDGVLKKILERFYQYFPKYMSYQPYLTLSERMKILLDTNCKSKLVDRMAYVLRQMTVDELCKNPLAYREAFAGLNAQTPIADMRDPETKLLTIALKALAHAVGIMITLSFKEPGKELRSREVYVGGEQSLHSKLNLIIQVQGEQYFPTVKHKTDFAYVGQLATTPLKPEYMHQDEGTLADIIALISQDNKELLQTYEQWRKSILNMYGRELNFQQLQDLFINFYPVEQGRTLSLPELEKSERKPVIASVPEEEDKQTVELLASYLAGWISTKQIPDDLFDQIEKPKPVVSGM